MMDELGEDEDVIIEGSELHRALVNMGYEDFELSQTVNKNSPPVINNKKWYEKLEELFIRIIPWKAATCQVPRSTISKKQLVTILEAESLLDDHAVLVQSFLEKNSQSFWNKLGDCWTLLGLAGVPLTVIYSTQRRTNTFPILLSSLIGILCLWSKYKQFCAIKGLKKLVCLQNELYSLYKKGLRILGKEYPLRKESNVVENKFSKLEIDKIKYLQPITETLLKSMENVSRIYYTTSQTIVKLLPKSALFDNSMTNFKDDAFTTGGEITYESLKSLYYIYILVQSEVLQLLAIAYDEDTWISDGGIPHEILTRIVDKLYCSLRIHGITHLASIIKAYDNCKSKTIQRHFRVSSVSRYRDLHLNLDLLSRKIKTIYDITESIIVDIEKRGNLDESDDNFDANLATKAAELYTQIDNARNFAELNKLLLAIVQKSRRSDENSLTELSPLLTEIEEVSRIVRDSEPQIIDEVFEEYITGEYLKPLYDENQQNGEEFGMENAKFDKLLAKNFMSELKEALIDKYKSMSERESKALLRKYQTNCRDGSANEIQDCSKQIHINLETNDSGIPPPPPFSELVSMPMEITPISAEIYKPPPLPLPRRRPRLQIPDRISPDDILHRPAPPPPPPLPVEIDLPVEMERFSIDIPSLSGRKMPSFVALEEEFIGSGENSEDEEELNQDDSDLKQDEQ